MVLSLDRRPRLEEEMDGGDVAVEGGEVQRAVAMRVGGEVTCTRLEQRPHHRRVAGVAAHDQRRLTWLGLGLGLGLE